MPLGNRPVVSIAMLTYNHEKYIAEAIESVICQKTNFFFELVIGEDFSTDKTRQICRLYQEKYSDIIRLIENEENIGLIGNYKNVFANCNGKYIAILEGDDYWNTPFKLQKQVDILESNDQISLVHTDFDRLFENGKRIKRIKKNEKITNQRGNLFEKIFLGNSICAGTVCFRKQKYIQNVNIDEYLPLKVKTIDAFLWIEISRNSIVEYINDSTLTYRVLPNSISNNRNYNNLIDFIQSSNQALLFLFEKYKPQGVTIDQINKRSLKKMYLLSILFGEQANTTKYYKLLFANKEGLFFHVFLKRNKIFKVVSLLYRTYTYLSKPMK